MWKDKALQRFSELSANIIGQVFFFGKAQENEPKVT